MATETNNVKLFYFLEKSLDIVKQYSGGYSGRFLSAEDFYHALKQAVDKYRNGDVRQIENFYNWFAPTSCWDDFTGESGLDLGEAIFDLVCKIKRIP